MNRIELEKEHADVAVEEIKKYFANERDESIGDLQSKLMLNFILEKIGPTIYNQAIADTQKYMNERIEELYGLMR